MNRLWATAELKLQLDSSKGLLWDVKNAEEGRVAEKDKNHTCALAKVFIFPTYFKHVNLFVICYDFLQSRAPLRIAGYFSNGLH